MTRPQLRARMATTRDRRKTGRGNLRIALAASLLGLALGMVTAVRADVLVTPAGEEVQIPIQTEKRFEFRIPKPLPKHTTLEMDARVQRDGVGGYSPAAVLTLNGAVIGGPRLVNKPLVFKTAVGGVAPWYGDGEKAWCLYYAESFAAVNGDAESNTHRPIGASGCHFVFDISDLARENNVLTIRNRYDENVQREVKAAVPVVVANLTVGHPERIARPDQAVTPYCYAMPPRVVPRRNWEVKYDVHVSKDGGMIVGVGGASFSIGTRWSYPHGGWNTFSSDTRDATAEAKWHVAVRGEGKEYSIEGEGEFYRVTRRVRLRDDRIDVSDTIANKNAQEDVGIVVRNEVAIADGGDGKMYWGGGEVFLRHGSAGCPENPTFYLTRGERGIGLAAVDDVFRVHHATFVDGKAGGLEDDRFALPPGGAYTMEWSIYPTADADYFSFINSVRRDWGLNSLLAEGGIAELGWGMTVDAFPSIESAIPKTSRMRRPESKYVLVCPPSVFPKDGGYIVQYGYPMLQLSADAVAHYKGLIRDARAKLGPEKKLLGYYGPTTFCVGKESQMLFKECRVTLRDGESAYGEGGTVYPLYYPTETNAFGKMIGRIVEQWLEWGVDGIYFDYFDPSACGIAYTYNTWDGHTAEIDPGSKTIRRKYASLDLLARTYLASLVRRIERRGGVIFANRGAMTRTMTEATRNIPRLGESGTVSQLLRAHLTPCPAGFQRTHLRDIHAQILGALDYGILSYAYDETYSFSENPLARIYPIKVMELHQGYVIGEDKIVTKRSGLFGWGDNSKITCFLHDKDGHRIANAFSIVLEDGCTLIDVQLGPGQLAILDRSR